MTARTRASAPTQALAKANVAQRQLAHAGLTWLDMIQPGITEVTHLRERFSFDPLTLEDVLSKLQRPKLDVYAEQEYLFIVLHFPVLDRYQRAGGASEVDLFVGPDYVITLHEGDLKPLRRMFAAASTDEHAREQLMSRGSGYLLYRIVDALVRHCFPMIYRADDRLARLDERVFGRNARETVQDLAFERRDNIALRRIIKPDLPVIRLLAAREHAFLRLDTAIYFGDIVDGLRKLCDMLEEQQEVIESLTTTLDSLTWQRSNQLLKILTVVGVALLPLTLIAGIYGMNASLPLAQHPYAFILLILVMFGAAAGLVAYLRYRNWI